MEDPNAESLRRLRAIREGSGPAVSRALPVKTAQDELRELEERERKAKEASGSATVEADEREREEELEEEPEPATMTARERKLFELRRRMVKVRFLREILPPRSTSRETIFPSRRHRSRRGDPGSGAHAWAAEVAWPDRRFVAPLAASTMHARSR